MSVGRTSEVRWRSSFSVFLALAKGLPAQVCFSFGQVGLPWLRHVLFGRRVWAPLGEIPSDVFLVESTDLQVRWMHFVTSVDANPKSLHDVLFYATVARALAEILRSAQTCTLCRTTHALADRRSSRSAMWRLRPSWMQRVSLRSSLESI